MKGFVLSYKMLGLALMLMLSSMCVSGAEYKGDQIQSPFMRFLHSLFWGGSGNESHFDSRPQGQTYQYSSLAIGASKTGGSVSGGSSSQQDIWAGYGQGTVTPVATRKLGFSRVASVVKNSGNSVANSSTTDGYVSPLTSAVAATTSSSGSSSSSGTSEVSSISMPSLLALQTTQQTLATTVDKSSQSTTDTGDGWGDDGGGASDPQVTLPVGDGTFVLLFLISLYVFLNRKRFRRLKPQT